MRRKVLPGLAGLALFGCGSGLGDVVVQEVSSTDPPMPSITVSRLQTCFSIHGGQLPPGRHQFHPVVKVDQDGMRWGVETPDMPSSAADLAACTRMALGDMTIPDGILKAGSVSATNELTPAQRSYMGNPAVVVIVVVGLSEIVLEAGAYTILFAVTVKVVDKAKDDVVEALKRRPPITDGEDDKECVDGYERCILSGGGVRGNNWNTTVCENCLRMCQNKGGWPYSVPIFGRGNPLCY